MGKWRRYSVGKYRLQQLNGRAHVVWLDEQGRRQRRVLGATDEVTGRAELDAFAKSVSLLRARQATTIGELYAAYAADRERDGKLADNFHWSWRALAPRFGSLPFDALTVDACRDYAEERLRTVKPGTVWTELNRLRSCLNWAEKRRVIQRAPYVWVPSKPAPKDRVLTPDEVAKLMEAAVEPHVRLFMVLAITTGARAEAILELTWAQVDFNKGLIDLRSRDVANPLTKRVRKGRSIVPMTEEARFDLLQAKAGALTDHVIEYGGKPIGKISKGFNEARRRAALSDVTPHTLRHSVVTWLNEDGIPLEDISRMVGHKDVATTRRIYAHPSAETLRPAADAVSRRLRR
jgi:integrase